MVRECNRLCGVKCGEKFGGEDYFSVFSLVSISELDQCILNGACFTD